MVHPRLRERERNEEKRNHLEKHLVQHIFVLGVCHRERVILCFFPVHSTGVSVPAAWLWAEPAHCLFPLPTSPTSLTSSTHLALSSVPFSSPISASCPTAPSQLCPSMLPSGGATLPPYNCVGLYSATYTVWLRFILSPSIILWGQLKKISQYRLSSSVLDSIWSADLQADHTRQHVSVIQLQGRGSLRWSAFSLSSSVLSSYRLSLCSRFWDLDLLDNWLSPRSLKMNSSGSLIYRLLYPTINFTTNFSDDTFFTQLTCSDQTHTQHQQRQSLHNSHRYRGTWTDDALKCSTRGEGHGFIRANHSGPGNHSAKLTSPCAADNGPRLSATRLQIKSSYCVGRTVVKIFPNASTVAAGVSDLFLSHTSHMNVTYCTVL